MHDLQAQMIEDLSALRNGDISISEARTRATIARTIVEAEKVELIREQMTSSGVLSSSGVKRPRLAAI